VSRADVASSRIRTGGFFSIARASAKPLPFPAGDLDPPLTDDGIVAVGHLADERVRVCALAASTIFSRGHSSSP